MVPGANREPLNSRIRPVQRAFARHWVKVQRRKARLGRPRDVGGLEGHLLIVLICYGCYITRGFLSFFYNVNRSAIRGRFAIIPGSRHDFALCRECQLRVESGCPRRCLTAASRRLCNLAKSQCWTYWFRHDRACPRCGGAAKPVEALERRAGRDDRGPGRMRRLVRSLARKSARQRNGGRASGHDRSRSGRHIRGSAAPRIWA